MFNIQVVLGVYLEGKDLENQFLGYNAILVRKKYESLFLVEMLKTIQRHRRIKSPAVVLVLFILLK